MNELQGRILVALHVAYKARPNYPGTRSDVLMAELGGTSEAQYVVAIKSLIARGYVESRGTHQHPYLTVKITPEGNELVEAAPPPPKPLGFIR